MRFQFRDEIYVRGTGTCTFLPRDCKQMTTEFRFCLSQRSTVWKVSCAGTPNPLAASRKAFIFSMHLKANDVLLIFFTEPSLMSFTSLGGETVIEQKRDYTEAFPFCRKSLQSQTRIGLPIFWVPAEQSAVLQDLVKVVHVPVGVYVLAGDRFDPFQTLLRQLFAVLAVDLHNTTINFINIIRCFFKKGRAIDDIILHVLGRVRW